MWMAEDEYGMKLLKFNSFLRPQKSTGVRNPIFHTGGVAGSIPAAPTMVFMDTRPFSRGFQASNRLAAK